MLSSQEQISPERNQESPPLFNWRHWRNQHEEFKRTRYAVVPFEGKILIVAGKVFDGTEKTPNLILVDPETEEFRIIKSIGDVESCCWPGMSACYWKDSKIVAFGGSHLGPGRYGSVVAVITLKDLDSENPLAHWEKMVTPTELFRQDHKANIHGDKMYVIEGNNERSVRQFSWTWSQCNFEERPPDDFGNRYSFHENKVYLCPWGYFTEKELRILELDFGKTLILHSLTGEIGTMTSRSLTFPGIGEKQLPVEVCPQITNGKLYFLTSVLQPEKSDTLELQFWACDLKKSTSSVVHVFSKKARPDKWIQPTPEGYFQGVEGSLLHCDNHLVLCGNCEDDKENSSFCFDIWTLSSDPSMPKTKTSSTSASVTKTQKDLKEFFLEAPYSDISFEVESQIIKAHKWWLAQRNKFFANMFANGMAESQASLIKITDMKASTFKALLEFLYSDHVEIDDKIALELLQQADKYSIGELKTACEKHLIQSIKPENYVALGQIAELIGAVTLRNALVAFIARNMRKLKSRKDFSDISDALLRDSIVKFIVK